MSLAQEAFARGLFKALRTAGIPVSAAQEGMFLSALKDSARGASQDIKEMTGLSKLKQGAERQIAIGEAQDAVAANQALAQGIGTAAETVGKMVIAQDQMKQSGLQNYHENITILTHLAILSREYYSHENNAMIACELQYSHDNTVLQP